MAPAQLLSVADLTVSARSGTLTLLSKCALRRTSAELQLRVNEADKGAELELCAPGRCSRRPRIPTDSSARGGLLSAGTFRIVRFIVVLPGRVASLPAWPTH